MTEVLFLSTLPARGATIPDFQAAKAAQFLSTLPARGATAVTEDGTRYGIISIHAPREGSDLKDTDQRQYNQLFLSTLPARGATIQPQETGVVQRISIHAPREGSDAFHPRCGEKMPISIHAPREGSDGRTPGCPVHQTYFYPRSPRGERLQRVLAVLH